MSIELSLILFVITYWAAVSFAYWWGWRARDRQQPPGGRYGWPRGYNSINYPDPSPDRRPTNPFNGERIPNPPPRKL